MKAIVHISTPSPIAYGLTSAAIPPCVTTRSQLEGVVAEGEQPADLAELHEVLAADRPQHDQRCRPARRSAG